MRSTTGNRWQHYLELTLLLGMSALLFAQETTPDSEPEFPEFRAEERTFPSIDLPPPGETLELELVIHRWGETDAPTQSFNLSLTEIPRFLSQASLSQSQITFDQITSEIPIQLTLSLKDGQEAKEENLVIEVLSEDESVSPNKRKLILPLKSKASDESEEEVAGNYDFVIRTLKEGYDTLRNDLDDHVKEIDTEAVPIYTVDYTFICFTAANTDVNFYFYRIKDPLDRLWQSGVNTGSSHSLYSNNTLNEMEGAPYEVIVPLRYRSQPQVTGDPGRPRMPGTYTLEVSEANYQNQGLFGIPTEPTPKEWKVTGTFELLEPVFHFSGTASLVFENENSSGYVKPYLELSPTTGAGPSGTATLNLEWKLEDEEPHRSSTTLQYEFPDTIPFNHLSDISNSSLTINPKDGEDWIAYYRTMHGLQIKADAGEFFQLDPERKDGSLLQNPTVGVFKTEATEAGGIYDFDESDQSNVAISSSLGSSNKSFGWHLRNPANHYGIAHQVHANGSRSPLGKVVLVGLYTMNVGKVDQVQLMERSRTMNRPDFSATDPDQTDKNPRADTAARDPSGEIAGTDRAGGSTGRLGTGAETDTLGDLTGDNGTNLRGGPPDPNALDPNSPDISGLITTWISIAEPPPNATEGANLTYNEWGVMRGTTRTGRITESPGKPDDVGLMNSPEYLWSNRTELDSVNHCTLEEYVIARLTGVSMEHCLGRYQPPPQVQVPGIIGRTLDQAEALLLGQELTPDWIAGPPAPNDDLAGTVASQNPAAGTRLETGSTVTVEVFIEPIRMIALPDVLGKSIDVAEGELQALGLEVILEVGDPARSAAQQFTVQTQTPVSGEQVDDGASVTLAVFSEYIPNIVLQDFTGKLFVDAEKQLTDLEILIETAVGEPAHSAESNNRVQSQAPQPGTVVNPGDTVALTIYSNYIPPPTVIVPSVLGMTMNQLADTLKQAGLAGRWRKGEPAPSPDKAQTVYKQTPAAGTEALEGSDVIVDMYDDAPAAVVSSIPTPPSVKPTTNPESKPPPTPTIHLPYLQPVQQLVVPPDVQGIGLNTGKPVMNRNEFYEWYLGDKTTHRSAMVAYGKGDPFGNFFEDDTDDTTHFLAIATWLENGDSWGSNPQFAPPNKTGVTSKTGGDVFLNQDNDAVAYFYFKEGIPATVILTVTKVRQNVFSETFRQAYADDIFEQLLGKKVTPATPSTIQTSTVLQIQMEDKIGSNGSLPLQSDLTQPLRKDAYEWMDVERGVRKAKFAYLHPNKPLSNYDGKIDVELYWLEKQDALTENNKPLFEQLTDWKRFAPIPGFADGRLHDGPLYFHSPDTMAAIKLTSTNGFLYLWYYEAEAFAESLFAQLRGHAKPKNSGYSPMPQFRLPPRIQELIPQRSAADFRPRSETRDRWMTNSYPMPHFDHAQGFARRISFGYYTGNQNTGTSTSTGGELFGIPSGNVQFAKNDSISCYFFWLEKGDPFSPDLKRAFIGRDTVLMDNKFTESIGTNIYYFHSSRVAAILQVYVDNYKGSQRKQALQSFANELFRQLEGHALRPEDIPTSANN